MSKNAITSGLFALLLVNIVLISSSLISSSAAGPSSEIASDSPALPVSDVYIDKRTGAVSIRVDGRTILEIGSSGITVTGNIRYTGGITDIGENAPAIASAGEAN